MTNLLIRGMLAGLLAGVPAFGFARIFVGFLVVRRAGGISPTRIETRGM